MRIAITILLAFYINLSFCQELPWEKHVIDNFNSGADGVRLADVNRDGLMDIATGWEEAGFTKAYLHPGYGKVNEKWPSVIVGRTPSVEDAVFIDLNSNGKYDIVSCTEGNSKKIFINWAPHDTEDYLDSSSWTSEILPASDGLMQWMYAIPMQVDGANGVDIVVGSKGDESKIGWLEAPTDPRNLADWKWHPISSCGWTMSLFIRDMDSDGDLDVITSDRRGTNRGVRWLENPGLNSDLYGEWENHNIGAMDREVMFMDLADIDSDGFEDAIVTEYTNQKIVIMRRLDETGLNWEEYEIVLPEIAGRAKSVSIGDINNDGVLDIVHGANTLGDQSRFGVIWFTANNNIKDASWNWHPISGPVGFKFDRIELLDLDGDGDLDVLTCEENYGEDSRGLGVIWYENPH